MYRDRPCFLRVSLAHTHTHTFSLGLQRVGALQLDTIQLFPKLLVGACSIVTTNSGLNDDKSVWQEETKAQRRKGASQDPKL